MHGRLRDYARAFQGLKTGDNDRITMSFWEIDRITPPWKFLQGTPDGREPYSGLSGVIRWVNSGAEMARLQGLEACGKTGIAVGGQSSLPSAIFTGELFESAVVPIIPVQSANISAIAAFCESPLFAKSIRLIDSKVAVTTNTFGKVPFDLEYWQQVAAERYPNGLPKPFSSDPTQWLFSGHPAGSDHPLHVAAARLVGFANGPARPVQVFPIVPAMGLRWLWKPLADDDGIVCLSPIRGEAVRLIGYARC
jgi:hypothetical protein